MLKVCTLGTFQEIERKKFHFTRCCIFTEKSFEKKKKELKFNIIKNLASNHFHGKRKTFLNVILKLLEKGPATRNSSPALQKTYAFKIFFP